MPRLPLWPTDDLEVVGGRWRCCCKRGQRCPPTDHRQAGRSTRREVRGATGPCVHKDKGRLDWIDLCRLPVERCILGWGIVTWSVRVWGYDRRPCIYKGFGRGGLSMVMDAGRCLTDFWLIFLHTCSSPLFLGGYQSTKRQLAHARNCAWTISQRTLRVTFYQLVKSTRWSILLWGWCFAQRN